MTFFNPRHYFDLSEDLSQQRVILIDKSDGFKFKSTRQGQKYLKWRCVWRNSGCDASFRTDLAITQFEGHPHLYHSNHGNDKSMQSLAKAMNEYLQQQPDIVVADSANAQQQNSNSQIMVENQENSNQNIQNNNRSKPKRPNQEEEKNEPLADALSGNPHLQITFANGHKYSSIMVPNMFSNQSSMFDAPQIQNSLLQNGPMIKKDCIQNNQLCNLSIVDHDLYYQPNEPLTFFRCKPENFQTEIRALLRALKDDIRQYKDYRRTVKNIGSDDKKSELYGYILELQREEQREDFDIKTVYGRSIILEHIGELNISRCRDSSFVKLTLYPSEDSDVVEISSDEYNSSV